jgi:hypothetical protein
VTSRVFELFDDYAAAYARGERPRADVYLAQAGDDADELARLIDLFLASSPRPERRESDLWELEERLRSEPPLVELRASRGIRVDEVVDALVSRLGLGAAKRAKVKRYYQRLEGGLLEPAGVSGRVWEVIRDLLGPEAERYETWRPSPAAAPMYLRALDLPAELAPPAPAREAERDEVDALFTGG